jgi:hypothetical protein
MPAGRTAAQKVGEQVLHRRILVAEARHAVPWSGYRTRGRATAPAGTEEHPMAHRWRAVAAVAASVTLTGFVPVALYEDLFTYPEAELRVLFRDIVTGTGETCSAVTSTGFLGADKEQSGYFLFTCVGGERYVLQISNDGTGKIVECSYAVTLGFDCDRPVGDTPAQ